jgi:transcriptional regulator with XRE-family HTH domain
MIGEEVRRRREALGLTGAQLAARAGLAPSAVSQIETGKRSPTSMSVMKLAAALGIEAGELYPKKAQAPLPLEQPLTTSPEVREWLREQGAKFALLTKEEFSELVLSMDVDTNGEDLLDDIERLVGEITEEDLSVERALMREFAQGGELFPNTPPGPDLVKRASSRHKAVLRMRRALANEYQILRRSLMNYSMRLYEAGRTSDFLVHPRLAEPIRRQMLAEALEEESAA